MSKNAWTRAEYVLLLRAWQDMLEQDAADTKLSSSSTTITTSTSKSSKDDSKSKAAVGVRVYERFNKLSDGGASKRTQNATTLQRAVLSFNFSFILQYNMAHGVNAWVSLSREEREQVYNREKTTSYYFVDLDPSMISALTAIRKLLASGSAAATVSAASASSSASGSALTPKSTRGRPLKKRGPKPRAGAGNARQVYRAIIDAKSSDEEDESSSESSDGSSSEDDESDSSADLRATSKRKSKKESNKSRRKRLKTTQAAMLDVLSSIKKDVRHLEKLIVRDQHDRREAQLESKKKRISGDEEIERS